MLSTSFVKGAKTRKLSKSYYVEKNNNLRAKQQHVSETSTHKKTKQKTNQVQLKYIFYLFDSKYLAQLSSNSQNIPPLRSYNCYGNTFRCLACRTTPC